MKLHINLSNDCIDNLNKSGLKRDLLNSHKNKVYIHLSFSNVEGYYYQKKTFKVDGKSHNVDVIFVTAPGVLP